MAQSRRALVGAVALAVATPALLRLRLAEAQGAFQGSAGAAAPGAQAPGFYRFRVGSHLVTMLYDGFVRRQNPAQGVVTNAEPAAVEAALRDSLLRTDVMEVGITASMVEANGRRILFDAGSAGAMGPTTGRFSDNLRSAGIEPASITDIVISHFHPDHINGLTGSGETPVFGNARVHVPEREWRFWSDPANGVNLSEARRAIFGLTQRRLAAPYRDRIQTFGDEAEVLPSVRAVPSYGHTPGHTSFLVSDGNAQLLVLVDAVLSPALFVRNPGWHHAFDMDGPMAEQSRRRLLDRAAADRLRVTGYHFSFPANGYIGREGDRFRYHPAEWSGQV